MGYLRLFDEILHFGTPETFRFRLVFEFRRLDNENARQPKSNDGDKFQTYFALGNIHNQLDGRYVIREREPFLDKLQQGDSG